MALYGGFVIKEMSIWTVKHLKRYVAMYNVKIMLAMVLAVMLVFQCVDGNQKIVHVSELIGDGEGFFDSASGKDDNSLICCVFGNCSCNSIDLALAHLTSNVLINITTDVMLSSIIKVSPIENVSLVGHNNPIVSCKNGGIHLTFCHNCVIQGITWNECGTKNIDNHHTEPALKLYNASNVTIHNCSFLHSVGQAVVLSEILGDVNINSCRFSNNSHYKGHGTAIHYSSNNSRNFPHFVFAINSCNFINNRYTKSLIHIENKILQYQPIMFNNTTFSNNQGVSITVINNKIYFSGQTLFYNNTAENGAGIYASDHSTITFDKNSNVTFIQNSVNGMGGAVFVRNKSTCEFDQNSEVKFYYNTATRGGAIYSEINSNVTFKATSKVTFSSNLAVERGAAIYSLYNSHVIFTGNTMTTFNNNIVPYKYNNLKSGGILYTINNCLISFEGNSTTVFANNTAYNDGTILMYHSGNVSFTENSNVVFSNNSAYSGGGAMSLNNNGYIFFGKNTTVLFGNNSAHYYGGAIYLANSHINFEENSSTVFSDNTAKVAGGAIGSFYNSYISCQRNSTTLFCNNSAYYGGAIHSDENCHISFEGNSIVAFRNNTANSGGAVSDKNCCISFKENSTTEFSNNSAKDGGAIYSHMDSYISFEGNTTTLFSNNTADQNGGAIHTENSCIISFGGKSSTILNDNTASYGGAISNENNCDVSFEDISTTVFSNNTATGGGGIFVDNQCGITFDNNSAVFFNNNTATFGTTVYFIHGSRIKAKGNFSATFNNLPAKWCSNTCLPYAGQDDVAKIENNGIIWCSNLKIFICLSIKCYCKKLEDVFSSAKDHQIVNILDNAVVLSSDIELRNVDNISIIGYNNPYIICINGGKLLVQYCNNFIIEGITWVGCGIPGAMVTTMPSLEVNDCMNVKIQKCSFQYSMGQAVRLSLVTGYLSINNCKFLDNYHYRGHGAAIYYSPSNMYDTFIISNCDFSGINAGKSIIYFKELYRKLVSHANIIHRPSHLINSSFRSNQGVSIYLSSHHNLHIKGKVLFEDNVAENGAGIYISDLSTVVFDEDSITNFINNSADHNGAAIFLEKNATIEFDMNSIAMFNENKATNGTIYSMINSNVVFEASCEVIFSNNSATQYGAAIYSSDNSHVTFRGHARVTFINNNVIASNDMYLQLGGIIYSENNCYVSFREKSTTVFNNNFADFGAAIFSIHNSNVIFKDRSRVRFHGNVAHYCGVMASILFSIITFTNDTNVTYDTNTVSHTLTSNYDFSAGTICTIQKGEIIFSGHSLVKFVKNTADKGGAVIIFESNVICEEYSTVIFNNNFAWYLSGGALVCSNNSNVTIKGNSNVTFTSNKASQNGGAIHSYNMCRITVKDNSTSTFINNIARSNGGAILGGQFSEFSFEGNSLVIFDNNEADNGGVFYFTTSTITFKGSSMISFYNNKARQSSGVGHLNLHCSIIFEDNSTVEFNNNLAEQNVGVLYSAKSNVKFRGKSTITITYNEATINSGALYFNDSSDVLFSEFTNITFLHNRAFYGGAVLCNDHSNITLQGSSVIFFVSNEATESGGAGYFNYNCNFIIKENATVTFDNNKALQGGAVNIKNRTKLIFKRNSTALFSNNVAGLSGGAINILNDSSITLNECFTIKFTNNNAVYGGAILLDTTGVMVNNSYNKHCINFTSNIAKISGNSVYQDTDEFCNANYLRNRLVGISIEFVNTPPNVLKFYDPAVCIDNDNNTQCYYYYLQDIMLGTHIAIPACVLDYYNQTIDSTQLLIQSETHPNLFITGPKQVLISCSTFEGISIMGNQTLLKPTNFSINITLNVALNSNWKHLLVNLIIELSPCHPGFWQYPNSKKCECYNASDIVFCSGSSSTIKRGYWFGSVAGKPTVTFCPDNYCNFTCCETSNGYYHLSPVRDDQCRSHRSGVACGRCKEGYTLSFDSVECIHMKECSIGQKILLLALILLYWTIIIVTVFSLMHFKVGIGYLYAITFYYSVVDILLCQNWYHLNAPIVIINVMSSIAKITPQFLGQLCFIENMSGIDQQFIHYIHPVAISLFLVMITVLARRSQRLSFFISKGIIHVICCLLLLSYTSLATTSLLLMRPLIFHDINKVYTYVSPDVEYFHGRHLVYALVALIFTIVIVIGLPLLLALEPFLNSKINFVKVKPLLDQFQGCYKDNYRCFASYYMICRLIIITIVIANPSNDFIFRYLLITACVIMALVHQIFRPYSNSVLNMLDGAIFHFLVLASVLPLAEFYNNFDSKLVVGITFILVILPFMIFITMSIMINKEKLKKLPGYCYFKCSQLYLKYHSENPLEETEELSNENELINVIDDSRRINATICDV